MNALTAFSNTRPRFLPHVAALSGLVLLVGCSATSPATDKSAQSVKGSCAKQAQLFSTDDASGAADYKKVVADLGPVKKPAGDVKIGSIMKFLGNQYWAALSKGETKQGNTYGTKIDVQAAASESDQLGQLNAAQTMVQKGYKALLVSPQTDTNLCPAVEKAESSKVLVMNVNDAVLPNAQHWVGPNQIQNGVTAAEFVAKQAGKGAEVAIIQGQAGVYAARQRTKGFTDTATKDGLKVVASVPGDWDISKAQDAASTILQSHPNLKAFYANNDIMALGVAEAVKKAGKSGKVIIVGTDGIADAYDAIRKGSITATVDSYPELTGQVAVEMVVRLLDGQKVPRAVYTPQALITKANVNDPAPTLQ
jgi:ribose transport system substrate-binding protein